MSSTDNSVTNEARVNMRWPKEQLDIVIEAAKNIDMPYQTYIRKAALAAASADLEAGTAGGGKAMQQQQDNILRAFESLDSLKAELLKFFPVEYQWKEIGPRGSIEAYFLFRNIRCGLYFGGWFDSRSEHEFWPEQSRMVRYHEGGPHLSIWFEVSEKRMEAPSWLFKYIIYNGVPGWYPVWDRNGLVKPRSPAEVAALCVEAICAFGVDLYRFQQEVQEVLKASFKDNRILKKTSDDLHPMELLVGGKHFTNWPDEIIHALHTQDFVSRQPLASQNEFVYNLTNKGRLAMENFQELFNGYISDRNTPATDVAYLLVSFLLRHKLGIVDSALQNRLEKLATALIAYTRRVSSAVDGVHYIRLIVNHTVLKDYPKRLNAGELAAFNAAEPDQMTIAMLNSCLCSIDSNPHVAGNESRIEQLAAIG